MKKRIVADSTALVLLAKSGLLEISAATFDLVIPPSVASETSSDSVAGKYPDAALVRDLIRRGMIKVAKPGKEEPGLPISIHAGERHALALALGSPGCLFATDDGKAIKAARYLKIPFVITPRLVIELFRVEKVSLGKARAAIEKLGVIGRYSPEIIAEALFSLMEMKNGKADNHKNP